VYYDNKVGGKMQRIENGKVPVCSWLIFLSGILFCIAAQFSSVTKINNSYLLCWIIGVVLTFVSYKSIVLLFELTVPLLLWLILNDSEYNSILLMNLCLMVLFFLEYRIQMTFSLFIAVAFSGVFVFKVAYIDFTTMHWAIYTFTILLIVVYLLSRIKGVSPSQPAPKLVDIVTCSYTSNTAHFANTFMDELKLQGVSLREHRFHYHNEFTAELNGDSLVIAFPVIGWKPPWPLFLYLIKKLPLGYGKPAFILYTAAGGPENAGILPWLILTIKGYVVLGRCWGLYPVNVPTVRIGSQLFWNRIDGSYASNKHLRSCRQAAMAFSKGMRGGFPFILFPFPLFIIGIIVENKYLNHIYKFYIWKKRCIHCERCVQGCPSQRLSFDNNGKLQVKGECVLCFGCINICPTNALHGLFFTEYGRQYKPRWSQYLVNKKEHDNKHTIKNEKRTG
jgi:ferredoxin